MATASASVPVALRGAVGGYKDIQTVSYSKEGELQGTGKFSAATFPHYLPVWDKYVLTLPFG